ncbi:MAG TPA: helix-turn-helix transcriptional regulator [Epulopiscium sp.]|nr:helix-turn-helix transcriptional regulator [Candidatus Epulonipiscium sp.]
MISKKIKILRKEAKMSQEFLADQLNVSRQAVTKWETGVGTPDVGNLMAIAKLFQISVDELLGSDYRGNTKEDFLFESITEYDIDETKDYDIRLMNSRYTGLFGYQGEKIKIRLASNKISDIQSAFKVKLDDIKNRLDIDVKRMGDINETLEKTDLYIFIYLPLELTDHVEIKGNTKMLEINKVNAEGVEVSGKVNKASIMNLWSHIEMDSNEDMEIRCNHFTGGLDINQIAATSRLYLPSKTDFLAVSKGLGNSISYERQGEIVKASRLEEKRTKADLMVELNGVKSKLVIITEAPTV